MVSSTIAHTWLGKLLCINYTDDTYLLIWRVSRILFGKKHVTKWCVCVCVYFRAACGSSQARGQIRAIAASLGHSHWNVGSKPRLRPTPQVMAVLDPYLTERG